MAEQHDYKKEWEKAKKSLLEFSQKAAEFAKKSEDELVAFSKKSMIQIDSTAIGLKKEKLYYAIGKEYVQSLTSANASGRLEQLVKELNKIEKEQKTLKAKLSRSKKVGATRKKRKSAK